MILVFAYADANLVLEDGDPQPVRLILFVPFDADVAAPDVAPRAIVLPRFSHIFADELTASVVKRLTVIAGVDLLEDPVVELKLFPHAEVRSAELSFISKLISGGLRRHHGIKLPAKLILAHQSKTVMKFLKFCGQHFKI